MAGRKAMSARILLAVSAALLAGCSSGAVSDPEQGASPTVREASAKAVTADCSMKSMADFGPAFADPHNLVVGPLLLVGGAEVTLEAVVLAHDGQKFPLLVKAGHRVTVSLPPEARSFAGLAYSPFPQGRLQVRDAHDEITFVACDRDEPSGSRAEGPVTFWSGFVMTSAPTCLPLDVRVDDEPTPRRVEISLGADCKGVPAA
jgi:hypothetical protein